MMCPMFKSLSDIFKGNNFKASSSRASIHQEVFDFLNFVDQWSEIVLPPFGKLTLPQKLVKGTLYLVTAHPALSQGMSFMEKKLIESIVVKFPNLNGKIRQLAFVVNSTAFDQIKTSIDHRKKNATPENRRKNIPHRYSPEFKLFRSQAEEIFKDIEDDESKELLISLYIQANFRD